MPLQLPAPQLALPISARNQIKTNSFQFCISQYSIERHVHSLLVVGHRGLLCCCSSTFSSGFQNGRHLSIQFLRKVRQPTLVTGVRCDQPVQNWLNSELFQPPKVHTGQNNSRCSVIATVSTYVMFKGVLEKKMSLQTCLPANCKVCSCRHFEIAILTGFKLLWNTQLFWQKLSNDWASCFQEIQCVSLSVYLPHTFKQPWYDRTLFSLAFIMASLAPFAAAWHDQPQPEKGAPRWGRGGLERRCKFSETEVTYLL